MGRLLKFEWKRLLNYKSFWIILLIVVVFSVLSVAILKAGNSMLGAIGGDMVQSEEIGEAETTEIELLGVDSIVSGMGDSLITLLPIFVAIFVASEFTNGTLKNVLSRGYSKPKVYVSKLISSSIAATIIIVAAVVPNTILSTIFWRFSDGCVDWIKVLNIILVKVVCFYAVVSLAVFISMTVRSVGGAVALNIGLIRFTPFILTSIATLCGEEIDTLSKYEITTIITNLSDTTTVTDKDIVLALLIGLIYISVSSIIGLVVFYERDL